ncbi:lipase family protein [Accumulibacter sp.]|uniref:lipase family protein n=1 Tax=Accumulibacter sp. TaxID=2053492 RepID=UPI0025E0B7BD|nr:lipase family protein [Accumulibacter sp.]MCM8612501.1 lipase family protein [Accumulibacter sp.]MCM8636394.1 lipase family protein [Accumulibacter sp.]MCM8640076.1 lipase family protein [Accumulibacter sp.]
MIFRIRYDATREALCHPGNADDFFQIGTPQDDTALCAEMSRLAYVKEEGRLAEYLGRAGFSKGQALGYGRNGTQVFIATARGGGFTVVAFRGTEPNDPSDLFDDAEFLLTQWCDAKGCGALGKVHEGFARAAHQEGVFGRVMAYLNALPRDHRVLITGHSLGAALATLLASWVPSAHLFTFGSPRVGNAAFAATMDGRIATRYVNCCDLVTQVPPEGPLGYAHVGKLSYIDRNGTMLLSAPSEAVMLEDEAKAQVEFLRYALVRGTVYSRALADHAPINYLSGVMGLRE